jgi:hypothetical protein
VRQFPSCTLARSTPGVCQSGPNCVESETCNVDEVVNFQSADALQPRKRSHFQMRSWQKPGEGRTLETTFRNGLRCPIPAVNDCFVASSRDEKPVATMERSARSCRKVRSSWYPITQRSVPASLSRTCITARTRFLTFSSRLRSNSQLGSLCNTIRSTIRANHPADMPPTYPARSRLFCGNMTEKNATRLQNDFSDAAGLSSSICRHLCSKPPERISVISRRL